MKWWQKQLELENTIRSSESMLQSEVLFMDERLFYLNMLQSYRVILTVFHLTDFWYCCWVFGTAERLLQDESDRKSWRISGTSRTLLVSFRVSFSLQNIDLLWLKFWSFWNGGNMIFIWWSTAVPLVSRELNRTVRIPITTSHAVFSQ